ncbi:MAG TPA: tRNA epoxyqueuosine(34) reductase QueG [Deltaproteobacteria bacterium]|nr:MAG: tRNA epoxyqueuosine(34) reductase QueG [Deltaproteobacteria bacterium GWA2_45_12]HBF12705.1 tRNA epoxyqueuosine(34) reductase QueG [Deltaproteobacteria bacterium]
MKSELIKQKAHEIGFDLVGITQAETHPHFSFFKNWMDHKLYGTMDWLVRGAERRSDPQKILPGAKSFICVGLNYYHGWPLSIENVEAGKGWVSNYAWGDDYHDVMLAKLKNLEAFILNHHPEAKLKSYVDTGPILERSYAESAGLGWVGKNTLLINQKNGSFFFLGEMLTDLELEYDEPAADHCGKCTRCLDACPTNALKAYELDANKCISYLTIEHRGEIDPKLQSKMGHHIYGCDICQDVCPWNRQIPVSREESFKPRPENFHPSLSSLKNLSQEEFSHRFKNSPIKRTKWEGLLRNIQINKNTEAGRKTGPNPP